MIRISLRGSAKQKKYREERARENEILIRQKLKLPNGAIYTVCAPKIAGNSA
jgi:hypothetical protein